jgi:hypothetical protein
MTTELQLVMVLASGAKKSRCSHHPNDMAGKNRSVGLGQTLGNRVTKMNSPGNGVVAKVKRPDRLGCGCAQHVHAVFRIFRASCHPRCAVLATLIVQRVATRRSVRLPWDRECPRSEFEPQYSASKVERGIGVVGVIIARGGTVEIRIYERNKSSATVLEVPHL